MEMLAVCEYEAVVTARNSINMDILNDGSGLKRDFTMPEMNRPGECFQINLFLFIC
jgi:hypothetical protein